jgi:phosphatidylserine/phosphatidylglycerophosphate/cardiolipin synthase-like enzyme
LIRHAKLSFLLLVLLSSCTTAPETRTGDMIGLRPEGGGGPGEVSAAEAPAVPDTGGAGDAAADGAEAVPSQPLLQAVVNAEYEQKVLDLLRAARETISVVHFECNHDSTIDAIIEELLQAHQRGVAVSVFLEGDVDGNADRVYELRDAGIEAMYDSHERYTHAKLVVVDSYRVLFGSTNLSYKSIKYNNETDLYVESKAAGEYFESYARALWEDPVATPVLEPAAEPSVGLARTLHDGDYFPAVHPLLQGAQKRIYLLLYGINMNPDDPESEVYQLVTALVEAHQRGLEVKVIIELSDYNDDLNATNAPAIARMAAACLSVRHDPLDQISHAKLLVVDDTAVVGSNNWGYGGFHKYHEVGGLTTNAEAVSKLSAYFLSVWDESAPVPGRCK